MTVTVTVLLACTAALLQASLILRRLAATLEAEPELLPQAAVALSLSLTPRLPGEAGQLEPEQAARQATGKLPVAACQAGSEPRPASLSLSLSHSVPGLRVLVRVSLSRGLPVSLSAKLQLELGPDSEPASDVTVPVTR